MASFLMIHGSWHGGWCFDRLRNPIEAAGHVMIAPDLPGMGGGARALASATLDAWADFTIEQPRLLAGPVILCGHSRGGVVISQAAQRDPSAFAALIYIAAMLAPAGRSFRDVLGEAGDAPFSAGLAPVANGLGVALSPESAIPAFYNRCTPDDQQSCAARLVAEPVRPLSTPVEITAEKFGTVPRHYIECTYDRTIPLDVQRAMQAVLPCKSVTTLDSDHSPFICMPEVLAAAMIEIAERIEACPRE